MRALRIRHSDTALIGAGMSAFLLVAYTGGTGSPAAPLISLWLFLAAWRLPAVASAMAMGFAVGALALMALAQGLSLPSLARVTTLVLAGAVPAALLRGSTIRRVVTSPPLPARAPGPDRGSDGGRRQELCRALHEVCAETCARRAVLWEIDGDSGTARQFASSDGELGVIAVALRGDPMGWVWQHGISLRVTPTPAWAAPDSAVLVLRVDRPTGMPGLISFDFDGSLPTPGLAALDNSLVPLRRLLALQDERNLVLADRRRLEMLVSALRRLPSRIDLSGFASGVLDDAIRITSATGGAVGVWVREEGRIVSVLGQDGGPPLGGTFEPLESEMALAARAGAMIVREARRADSERVAVATPADRWTAPPRSLAALPLATPDGVVGVIAVWSSAAGRLDPGALELLRTLAPFAAWQLAHALEYGRVRENAEHDGLTGLFNRRSFDQRMDAERARLERYGHPLALLLIDVDHFKSINDRFGHEAGDAVLRAVARVVQAGVRDVDMTARFGGEEFAVLLPETRPDAAGDVAERLRAAVERIELPWNGETIRVRISVGVSSWPDCVRDPTALIRSADAALYQAKTLGRNRVIRAPATG